MRSWRFPFSSVTTTQLMLRGCFRSETKLTGNTSEVSRHVAFVSCVVAIVGNANKVMHDMVVSSFLLALTVHLDWTPIGL
jgi:roadblock/LC7 domain-containing protein